jgi:anaerobic glycerol-3-phosphate dehydrogenase
MERFDLVVIGGGAAGVTAALAAAAAGLRTGVVRRSPGASGLGGGGWRGPLPGLVAAALGAQRHAHDAVEHPLPHPDGELRTFHFAPAGHRAALVEDGTCVVGIEGHAGFHAPALARLWGDAAGAEVIGERVSLPGTPAAGWSTIALARTVEANPAALADALHALATSTRCSRFILPAVLGVDEVSRVRAALEDAAGIPVGEALAVAPSLPGWRLAAAFDQALRAAGVEVMAGDVVDGITPGGRIEAVEVLPAGASRTLRLAAPVFVLATGRFVGGGIAAAPRFAEAVFAAPVWTEHLGERFDEADPIPLTDAARTAPQPLLAIGVHTDTMQRPMRGGGPHLENLFAAGIVRAGVDDGLGFAAADGELAVTHARAYR